MVNVCGHALCDNCVELLFVRGSGACPQCNVPLRRSNFRLQLFEDSMVEKEVDIRKKVLKDFNKKEDDFASLKEYNDYLEMVETIIYNLTNGIDVEETKQQIDQYRKENQEIIKKNRSKLSKDEQYLEMLIDQEQQEHDNYYKTLINEELEAKKAKVKNKEALINELMFSDLPAEHILASHKREMAEEELIKKTKPTAVFSTGIKIGKQNIFEPVKKQAEGKLYVYSEPSMEWLGPVPPEENQLQELGYLSHIRATTEQEKGGGFDSMISCQRALQDAFCGLYFSSLSLDSVTNKSRHTMDVS